jgi:hypothetical protein
LDSASDCRGDAEQEVVCEAFHIDAGDALKCLVGAIDGDFEGGGSSESALRHSCARLTPYAFGALVSNLDESAIDEVFQPSNYVRNYASSQLVYGEWSVGDVKDR